jgi:hypothetical protein
VVAMAAVVAVGGRRWWRSVRALCWAAVRPSWRMEDSSSRGRDWGTKNAHTRALWGFRGGGRGGDGAGRRRVCGNGAAARHSATQ